MAIDRNECRAAFEAWLDTRDVIYGRAVSEWCIPTYEPAGVACMWIAWQAAWSHHDPLPSPFSEKLYDPTARAAKATKRGFFS